MINSLFSVVAPILSAGKSAFQTLSQYCLPQRGTMIGRVALGVVLSLAVAGSVSAKNMYVRPNGATYGSGNGTSWDNAWSGFGAVAWGSGTTQLAPGDTLFVAAGNYTTAFTAGGNGSAVSPITVRAAQDTYVGVATFTGTIGLSGRSYVILDGGYNGSRNFAATNSYVNGQNSIGAGLRYFTLANGQVDLRFARNSEISYVHVYVAPEDEWAINGEGSANTAAWDQTLIQNCYILVPGAINNGTGGDGIKPGRGFTVKDTVLQAVVGTVSNAEHQDLIQIYGNNFIKVHGCEFIDSGDAQLGVDNGGSAVSNMRFYNNVFRRTIANMGTVMLRIYNSGGTISSFSDVRIDNNTFVDGSRTGSSYGAAIRIHTGTGSTSATASSIQNNIFYNCGNGWPAVLMEGITANWAFNYNLINAGASGNINVSGWMQANGQLLAPKFTSYTAYALNNNYRLLSTDTSALDRGTSLASYFTTDKAGLTRPQGAAWDIGAFEFASTGPVTNAAISVSPPSLDFGSLAVGQSTNLTFTVRNAGAGTLSGAASVGLPFSIVSGGTYSLGSNQSQTVTVRYAPTAAGNHSQSVAFTGADGAMATVSGSAWSPMAGLNFSSTAGAVSAPFSINAGGYISQSSETDLASGGRAVYGFTITNAGDYTIVINVNAPDTGSDSVFINIDAEPTDPAMIWDVLPLTSGFEPRTVGWRGTGDNVNPQFPAKTFTLAAGAHQLIIRGREADALIGQISLLKQVQPPSNLRLVQN